MESTLLQVFELTVNYRDRSGKEVPALVNVTFDVRDGEAVGLLGESGCGKTSTGLSLLRLLPASARIIRGAVRWRGKDLQELSGQDMESIRGAQVSMIFQEPSLALNPVMRVGDQVAEVFRAHRPWNARRCREAAEEMLARVRLSEAESVYGAYPHEISGGQRQRVLIAQALACSPALVIADEPTTGLDTKTQAEILDLLRELKVQYGTAFLFISHHPGVLARLADRLLVMYAGRIVEEGELARVYRNPLHPYTRGLLGSMPDARDGNGSVRQLRLTPIPGSPPDMGSLSSGCPFAPRCPVRLDICADLEPADKNAGGTGRVRCHVV